MPTYHFRCDGCEKQIDQKMSFGSTEVPKCEACKAPMKKFIVAPHVHFKGDGFYKNDAKPKPAAEKSGTTDTQKKSPPSSPAP